MREFTDSEGGTWEVWAVYPTPPRAAYSAEFPHVSPDLVDGWLCFQAGAARRRLVPIPADWEQSSDHELRSLCLRATAANPR